MIVGYACTVLLAVVAIVMVRRCSALFATVAQQNMRITELVAKVNAHTARGIAMAVELTRAERACHRNDVEDLVEALRAAARIAAASRGS